MCPLVMNTHSPDDNSRDLRNEGSSGTRRDGEQADTHGDISTNAISSSHGIRCAGSRSGVVEEDQSYPRITLHASRIPVRSSTNDSESMINDQWLRPHSSR
jgi:hypothetical protein